MKLKDIRKIFFIDIALIILIFLLDRISKVIIINLDKNQYSDHIFSSKFLNIHLVWNEGIAFGLFSVNETAHYNILTFIIILVIFFVFYMVTKSNGFERVSLLIIFSGAIGNLFDRIIYKAVPDFLDLHVDNFHWFIFNVADIFITIGVIFMIIHEFTYKNKKKEI